MAYSGFVEAGDLKGQYPARKTIATEFAHIGGPKGLKVQIDGIAYRGK